MLDDNIDPIIYESLNSDEYLHSPYWKASLSDGRNVYGKHHSFAWLQLKKYLQINAHLYITGLWFGFRDHVENVHTGESDYFFTYNVIADSSGWEQYRYIGGWRDDNIIRTKTFVIPEVYLLEEDTRSLDDLSVQRGLIRR